QRMFHVKHPLQSVCFMKCVALARDPNSINRFVDRTPKKVKEFILDVNREDEVSDVSRQREGVAPA
ncbi:MAG: hypothetical protein ACRETL_13540, partial [Gammaproteobacteria bacterium]